MKKHIAILAGIVLSLSSLNAQTALQSAYFLDGYNMRRSFNPAFATERSFFSLPALGGVGLGVNSNMGVNTFLFPTSNGKLTTFMSPEVSASDFLGKLRNNNRLNINTSVSLLTLGIWGKNGFFSFDANVKADVTANLPYELFEFVKNPGKSQYYDISDLAIGGNARLELAFGYTRRIADKINVGARLKLLAGLADVDARVDKMRLEMTGDQWSVHSKGTLAASCGFIDIKTKGESGTAETSADNDIIDFENIGTTDNWSYNKIVSGYGAALDLGADFELIRGLRLSVSVCDLGFISWKNTTLAETGEKGWVFDGFDNIALEGDKENSIDEQFNALGDDLSDLYEFRRTSTDGKRGNMLDCTLNAGVEYKMPFYDALSVGFLSSTTFKGPYTRTSNRLFANLTPCNWFSMSVNGALSSFGGGFGFILGLHPKGFNFFIGSDYLMTKFAKAAEPNIPYPYGKLRMQLNFGMSFSIGKRHELRTNSPLIEF
ncbi:MAG: DUF5723 family protein [Candidatus Cryptobacteroides sp.]